MTESFELKPDQLRNSCSETEFDFESTAEIEGLSGIAGQDRALDAIEFGMGVDGTGFNVYVLGPAGTGRSSTVEHYVSARAKEKPEPFDWCYVNNFKDPSRPVYIRLKKGKGQEFRTAMEKMISTLKTQIEQALENENYERERNEIMQDLQREQRETFSRLEQKARSKGFTLQQGPSGVAVIPVVDGKPVTSDQFAQMKEEEREKYEKNGAELEQELHDQLREVRDIQKQAQERLENLERQTILFAVEHHIEALRKEYPEEEKIQNFLNQVTEDVVDNAPPFIKNQQQAQQGGAGLAALMGQPQRDPFQRYEVNLLVDNSETEGAPVVFEHDPIYQNLIGRAEKSAQFGTLTTDYTMLKAGAIHRANGGYLIIEADHLLRNPFSYHELKHCLEEEKINIRDISERFSLISTTTLEPEPIPLDIKVILIGNPMIYYLLYNLDEEFSQLFKVKADFNVEINRDSSTVRQYAQFLAARCTEKKWQHFNRGGIARMVEYGSELLGDSTKLSTRFAHICDLAKEAHYWAEKNNHSTIGREEVQQAIDAKIYRANRIEETLQEMIERGDLFITLEGEVVGQVNGLSVLNLGDYSFGKPTRITARTFVGKSGVLNIDREVDLAGPIHNKGVLIMSGYLNGKYGKRKPVSMSASICFEQEYAKTEGDSASSAELYALLSSVTDIPIKQGFAVTGSVNQRGHVQPIGGANEKITGFFKTCKVNGLDGTHGILLPKTNVKNLMLSQEIVDAVREGKFHIYAVDTIDEGMEVLTGRPAGEPQADGTFPEGTINHVVEQKLEEFRNYWVQFQHNQLPDALTPESNNKGSGNFHK